MTDEITADDLEACITLCRRHLVGLQTAEGNFRYAYDWERNAFTEDDNAVRQAGTLWGLANLHRLRPDHELYEACRRGLAFYDRNCGTTANGGRFSTYPEGDVGHTGSTALVALALIELLRASPDLDPGDRAHWTGLLDEHLLFLLHHQQPDGSWPSRYDPATGSGYGTPSPYADGEALLALARAARHLGVNGLRDAIERGAAGAYRRHVLLALRRNFRARATSGYYQWGTMAMYEIIRAGWSDGEDYAGIIDYLADWMCGIRQLATGRNNPAAALEGLIHAYDLARAGNSSGRAAGYRDTITKCLRRMMSLQVGHPRAGEYLRGAPQSAPALGGCQHWPDNATLRIDFTQHQLHATLLAADMLDTA